MKRICSSLLTPLCLFAVVILSCGWFWGPGYTSGNRVYISTCNQYDACVPAYSYDVGDTNAAITARWGGFPADNAFRVGYPVSVGVMFEWDPTAYYDYGVLQYMAGTNTGSSTAWVTIGTITNDWESIENKEGTHFGVITWYPPATTNVPYLLRVYGVAKSGATTYYSSDLNATYISANGDGNTWCDWAVLGVNVLPTPVSH